MGEESLVKQPNKPKQVATTQMPGRSLITSDLRSAIITLLLMFAASSAVAGTFAVFKSHDRAQSWTRADAGLPGQTRINAFGSSDGVLFAGTDSGIFISRDEARNWQPATGAAVSSGRISSFASIDGRVLAGSEGHGLLISADAGASWAFERSLPALKVRCLLVHGDIVYAGTDAEGVFVSDDAGRRWTPLSTGLPSHAQIFAMTAVDGKIFAGLYSRGLYVRDEQQDSWAKIGTVAPLALASVQDTLIAGHNPGGLYWSGDMGVSWSKGIAGVREGGALVPPLSDDSGELLPEAPVWELAAGPGLVVAGASAGIYYSEDCGRTWSRARTGLPEGSPGIAFLLTPDFILAAAPIQGTATSETPR
jgi:photosystem II stability/assembly factor-like uncharacterized protein